MKKREFIVSVVLLAVFIAGVGFFWKRTSSGVQFLDYPNGISPERIWIGDMKNGDIWEVTDPVEKQYLMKNWNALRVKETGRFTGSASEEIQNYRFNIVVETTGYMPIYEVFLLDSPEKCSNDQIEYETVFGDNNFTYIAEKAENSSKDRNFTYLEWDDSTKTGEWSYEGTGGNAYETYVWY